ncbi:MAG TPA: biopolymer transporter ExbD [Steroidobacteraceae bacterium]|nr:biopolymer transporter ExbD [Steroidobacteraceae bacterium]
MNLRPRRLEDPEINLVSLIDVVLMMVVFFMLSSSLTQEGRIHIRLPQASSVPVNRPKLEPLTITVTEQGGYLVNGRELINSSSETLRTALLRAAGSSRNQRVTIRADARATNQSVVTAMDVLGRLGFAEIAIATVQSEPASKP